jgi:hypothetical protein
MEALRKFERFAAMAQPPLTFAEARPGLTARLTGGWIGLG